MCFYQIGILRRLYCKKKHGSKFFSHNVITYSNNKHLHEKKTSNFIYQEFEFFKFSMGSYGGFYIVAI